MAEIKTLTLDYSTWRCGEKGEHQVGKGKTALLNIEGYMCCLGQWSLELGATKEEMIGRGEPCELNTRVRHCQLLHDRHKLKSLVTFMPIPNY